MGSSFGQVGAWLLAWLLRAVLYRLLPYRAALCCILCQLAASFWRRPANHSPASGQAQFIPPIWHPVAKHWRHWDTCGTLHAINSPSGSESVMRPSLVVFATLAVASHLCFAAEQSRSVPEFKAISSQGAFQLVVNIGQSQSIIIKGAQKEIDLISTEVRNGELLIGYRKSGKQDHHDSVEIIINTPQLSKFNLEGAGATDLRHISGNEFAINYQGAGALKAEGSVTKLVLTAEGVGAIDARKLKSKNAEVSLNGVGSVKVHASESLNAAVNGIGSLTYYGHPAQVSRAVNGIGHVGSGD
jgi:hypothetical protein